MINNRFFQCLLRIRKEFCKIQTISGKSKSGYLKQKHQRNSFDSRSSKCRPSSVNPTFSDYPFFFETAFFWKTAFFGNGFFWIQKMSVSKKSRFQKKPFPKKYGHPLRTLCVSRFWQKIIHTRKRENEPADFQKNFKISYCVFFKLHFEREKCCHFTILNYSFILCQSVKIF